MKLFEIADSIEFIANEFELMDKTDVKNKLLKYALIIEQYNDRLETALENNKWISVKDRLPEIAEDGWMSIDVLATDGIKVFKGHKHHNNTWFLDGNQITQNITHWMPLPEPPKDEDLILNKEK